MPVLGYCRNLRSNLCPCFVCGKKFSLDNGVEDLLTHICFTHRIVIENIESIADFQKYMEYYLKRLQEAPLESFASSFVVEVPENDAAPKEQKYHVLGNSKEDEELRKSLHAKRLKAAQKQQRRDLSRQYFARHCFYCHQTIEVTNSQFIHHLRTHGFYLGHPEKLVYIERFVEAIEDNFRNLQCLYCDAKFDTCHALKKHMVDKNHQKIHPNNRFYDQFYMINYLEFGKTWLDFSKDKTEGEGEPDRENVDEVQDWSGWDAVPDPITCLFCDHVCRSWDGALLHMQALHNFDFKAMILPLKFYHQVKLVNYIRRRIADKKCINCDFTSENNGDIVSHMETSQHLVLPEKDSWNQACYFLPTKENDAILFHLEDDEFDDENATGNAIPVKQKSEILRHIEVENSESESGGSVCDDFCAMDVHDMDASSGSEADVDGSEASAAALPKKRFVKIKHWSGDSNENEDDVDYDDVFEPTYKDLRSEDLYANTAHTGAGDSVVKVTPSDESAKAQPLSEFGEVGPKGPIEQHIFNGHLMLNQLISK